MNFEGILVGFVTLFLIGLFHPIVIWCEYHFSWRVWPVFLLAGLICLGISITTAKTLYSVLWGVLGVTCLWSILELKEQEKRVNKGWFPKKPASKKEQNKNN